MHQLRVSGNSQGLALIFYTLFARDDYGATVCELLVLAAAVFIADRVPARRILRVAGEHPVGIAIISTVALCAGALFVYHDHPLSMDEYAAYFQSRVFAAGHLTGRWPLAQMDWLIPPGFQDFFLNVSHTDGRVISAYWPGHSLLLTPFTFAGIPWACNPVLTGLTLLTLHRLALHLFADVEAAGLALLLTVASPVIFGLGISYYSMPAHLLANCVYALLLVRPTATRALLAGIVGSLALCLHNPVPHLLFAAPWLIWMATRRGGKLAFGALCLGYLPLCLLLGIGWFEFSNSLVHPGPAAVAAQVGFMERLKQMLLNFAPPTATVYLARAIGVAKVWVWAVPGILILAACGAVRRWDNLFCRLLAASAVTTLLGYLFFVADQGHGWGFRYFHSAWLAVPLLATAALYRPQPATATGSASPALVFEDTQTRAFVLTCTVLTLVFGVGLRAVQMQAFMAADLAQMPHYTGHEQRVVFLDNTDTFYGADLVQNDPWLRGNEIRMFSHGTAADALLMRQQYPLLHEVYADRYGTVWSTAPNKERN
jgi:hypothetical protein